jgi:hypothetical protein
MPPQDGCSGASHWSIGGGFGLLYRPGRSHPFHKQGKLFGIKGFAQIINGAAFHGFHGALDRPVGGDHDDGRIGLAFPDFGQKLQAVHAGHFKIDQVQIALFLSIRPAPPAPRAVSTE